MTIQGSIDFINELNPIQYQAATSIDGPSMIIAGAGSGKTRVLTYRLAYIILQGAADPFQLMALTFTNKAAREMRERIAKLIGPDARHIAMGTFHSIFSRILRKEATKIGYTSDFTIYDEDDAMSLIKTICKEINIDDKKYRPRAIKNVISNAKNYLIDAAGFSAKADKDEFNQKVVQVFLRYEARCKQANAMDFDDLLVQTDRLLKQNPEIREKYRDRFRYLVVDEFQDTNIAQYSILQQLTNQDQNLCIVGDDAQSIYSFRGATIQNILNFQRDYPTCKIFKLEQNYRSTQTIIKAANKVIEYNLGQIPKKIFTENIEGDNIRLIEAKDDLEEAAKVVDVIREQKLYNNFFNKDFAILYRTNAQSRAIEDALRRAGIVYKIFGGLSFYRRAEIKDMVAYLRAAVNPNDEEAVKRIINYPARGIGDASLVKIGKHATDNNLTFWQALQQAQAAGVGRIALPIQAFVTFIKHLNNLSTTMPAHDFVETVAKESGILRELHKDKNPENLSKYENVQELIKAAFEFSGDENVEDDTVRGFLAEIALFTDQDQKIENDDYVTLMTIHAAKGLEFKSVFIVGVEENLFPSSMSMDTREGIEEERRLFYVAVTRAEKILTLAYARARYKYGGLEPTKRSRFLEEIADYLPRMSYNSSNRSAASETKPKFSAPQAAPLPPNVQKLTPLAKSATTPQATPSDTSGEDYQTIQDLAVGAKVEHNKFGIGIVKSMGGQGTDRSAVIDFQQKGTKTLLLRFAKLRLLN